MRFGLKTAGILGACAFMSAPGIASAAEILPVQINYGSGAYFSGNITFADDYSSILAVNGVLHGYAPFAPVYSAGASTVINQLLLGGTDLAPGRWNYGTVLTDGAGNLINLGFNYKDAPPPDFTKAGSFRSNVNGTDPFVTGAIVGGVPEPSVWLLLILGFGGVGFMLRRDQSARINRASISFAPQENFG